VKSFAKFLLLAFSAIAVARATTFELSTATVADINAAFDAGALNSEKLIGLYLARIAAYNDAGPKIHSLMLVNPRALEEARMLDAERKTKGPRSALHGIPVILKDNYNTKDMATTAGSFLLEGSIPPEDAFITRKLREAGAIILGKTNLSEFASGAGTNGFSSLGGQTRNPHDPTRGPAGSSGGSGAGIAAFFAQIGFGTDTGGSIRGPSSANGIVGLKPTNGLLSRAGIVPLSLSFDTGGPMTRSVADIAATLGLVTGLDPKDPLTTTQAGLAYRDYVKFLDKSALQGARIGVNRDFLGVSAETDRIYEQAIAELKAAGATIVDPIHYPDYLLKARAGIYSTILNAEFKENIKDYLATLKPGYPKDLSEMIRRAEAFTTPSATATPNPGRLRAFREENAGAKLTDQLYLGAKNYGVPLIRAGVMSVIEANRLDAIIYPTASQPARPINLPSAPTGAAGGAGGGGGATNIANITGYPDLIVPAGVTPSGLPVTLSFLGPAYSEPKLLALGYAYEQATHHRVNPPTTPPLPGEKFDY